MRSPLDILFIFAYSKTGAVIGIILSFVLFYLGVTSHDNQYPMFDYRNKFSVQTTFFAITMFLISIVTLISLLRKRSL